MKKKWNRDAAKDLQPGELVEIDRQPLETDLMAGRVLARGKKLLLLALIDYRILDYFSFVILRTTQIRRFRVLDEEGFLGQALALKGRKPPANPAIELDSMGAALESLAKARAMLAVHYEVLHPGECQVGRVRESNNRTVTLEITNPNGEWDGLHKLKHKDITMVEWEDGYTLMQLAVAEHRAGGKPTRTISKVLGG